MNAPAIPLAINRTMNPAQWAMLLALAVLWGGSFLFLGVAVSALPVFTVVALRVALAALVLLAAMKIAGDRLPRSLSVWGALIVMAVFNNVFPFVLLGWGQTHVASGLAAILNSTAPLFAAVAAHFTTTDEPLTPNRVVGVLLGLVGVASMFGVSVFDGFGVNGLAELACLGAGFCYGISGVYGRRFGRLGLTPTATAAGQLICSSVVLIALALAFESPWNLSLPAPHIIGAVIGLAVLSTALAYLIFYRLLGQVGAGNTMLVGILIPVFAILFGTLLLGEHLAPRHFIGLGLIALGLTAIDGRLWYWARRGLRTA